MQNLWMDIALDSLVDQLAALRSRTVSARELLAVCVDRVERLDEDVNSVTTLAVERAEAEAAEIDDRRARGETVGALGGAPITVKDAIATEGILSTGGATELADHVPVEDATVVRTVREEGAVVFAKTNLPRWSTEYQAYNEMFGTTNNPWDVERVPGGSSGGAGAAVAMGFGSFALATDIGGSIRVPASCCGVYGHKPSFGIVPTYGYLDHPEYHRSVADLNVFGPITRSVDDLDLLLEFLAGPSDDDAPGWRLELPPARATALGEFRVAAWLDDAACATDPAVLAVLDEAVHELERAGAKVDRRARPDLVAADAVDLAWRLEVAATHIASSDEARAEGHRVDHYDWMIASRRRDLLRQRWAAFFDNIDVLLCPVLPVPPIRHQQPVGGSNNWSDGTLADHGERPYSDLAWWMLLTGSVYLPATVAPVGRTDARLPIGMQVVAPFLHDRTAIGFAREMSTVLGGYEPPPRAQS